MEETEAQGRPGVDRRTLIRRSAIAGGAMVWAVPTVQTLAGPAFAAGSPLCVAELTVITTSKKKTTCLHVVFTPSNTCCNCINGQANAALAILTCASGATPACVVATANPC